MEEKYPSNLEVGERIRKIREDLKMSRVLFGDSKNNTIKNKINRILDKSSEECLEYFYQGQLKIHQISCRKI